MPKYTYLHRFASGTGDTCMFSKQGRHTTRLWAEQQGSNPQVVEKLFEDLVQYFIAEERKHWEGLSSNG